jgi:exonuclease SbcD
LRIVHLSDTHLGFSAYSKIDPSEGINQREADVYSAFQQAVDKAIELRPEVVIHSGDLFDTVRPQNRAIDFALRQLLRLSRAGIETVLISGNHSTPRLRETGNIFRIFEHLEHLHPVHEAGTGKIVLGDLTVTAIPHSTNPTMAELVSKARPSKETRYNVLVLHAGILDSDTYKMDEFNEQTVPLESVSHGWDYVALGHFHRYSKVGGKIYYSGSTERFGFGEADQDKGIIEADLDTGEVRFHPLRIRPMLDLPRIDASSLASSEILVKARDLVSSSSVDDKIVRMTITDVSSDAFRSLDSGAIRKLGNSAVHFEVRIDKLEAEGKRDRGDAHIGLLADEFRKYVSRLDMTDEKKAKLLDLGAVYLDREEER